MSAPEKHVTFVKQFTGKCNLGAFFYIFLFFSSTRFMQSVLGSSVRKEGDPHDCRNDAEAAMKLVLAKIEHGFDDPIAIEAKKVHHFSILVQIPSSN